MTWKNYIISKKKVTQRVAELMDKNARQIGFDAIRVVNWEAKVRKTKKYELNRLVKLLANS